VEELLWRFEKGQIAPLYENWGEVTCPHEEVGAYRTPWEREEVS